MNSFNISILTVFCIYFFYKFFTRKTHIDTEDIIDNDDKEDIFDNDDTTEKNIVIHENKYGKYIIVMVVLVFVTVSIFFMVKNKKEKNDFIEKKQVEIRRKYDEILSKSGGETQQQIRVGDIRRQYKQPQQQMNSLDYAKYLRKIRNLRLRRFKEEKKRTKKIAEQREKKYAKKNQVRNKQNEAKSQQNKNKVNQNQTMQQRIQRILGRKVY